LVVDSDRAGVELLSADVAVGGTGILFGDTQGFGSVIANDIVTDTDDAVFLIEGSPGVQADLRQGQQVLIVGDAESELGDRVVYRSNVKGPITSLVVGDLRLGKATLEVLGQSVIVDAATTFADTTLETLAVDDLVEVSGALQEDASVRASYIARVSSLSTFKVTGVVANLATDQFTIGGLTVDYQTALLSDFDGSAIASIADGDVVEVRGNAADFVAPADFAASEVEVLPTLTIGGGALVRIEGIVDRFADASDFDVQSASVATNGNTVFEVGDDGSLGLGVKVQIEGTLGDDNVVLAQTVVVQTTNAVRAEGPLDEVDVQAGTISLLGVTFALRDLTSLEDNSDARVDPLALSDLGIGDRAEARGYLDARTLVAVEVEREDVRDRAELRGPVTAIDVDAGTIDVLGVNISTQEGVTQFEREEAPLSESEFFTEVRVGDFVKVRWDVFADTGQVADDLSIEADD
jgi:hypothetical protein